MWMADEVLPASNLQKLEMAISCRGRANGHDWIVFCLQRRDATDGDDCAALSTECWCWGRCLGQ